MDLPQYPHPFGDPENEPHYVVVSNPGELQVGQFPVSQEVTPDFIGDPAFIITVPIERFRERYVINVPTGYTLAYVTIMKPAGSAVSTAGGADCRH